MARAEVDAFAARLTKTFQQFRTQRAKQQRVVAALAASTSAAPPAAPAFELGALGKAEEDPSAIGASVANATATVVRHDRNSSSTVPISVGADTTQHVIVENETPP